MPSRAGEDRPLSRRELERVFAHEGEGRRPILGLLLAGAISLSIWGGILVMLL